MKKAGGEWGAGGVGNFHGFLEFIDTTRITGRYPKSKQASNCNLRRARVSVLFPVVAIGCDFAAGFVTSVAERCSIDVLTVCTLKKKPYFY